MKTLQIIIFSLIVVTFVCGNNNVSNLISSFRNLTTINDYKMPVDEQTEIYYYLVLTKYWIQQIGVEWLHVTY